MPARTDIQSILIIGSGPIVIGQACEFDYSATQACMALKEEGYRIILINSNPATIMTDPSLSHATYIEPINPTVVASIIEKERPDALLSTMGGQTALNCAIELYKNGVLSHYGVELIGAGYESIQKAEDRQRFREVLNKLGLKTTSSHQVESMESAMRLLEHTSLPLIVRPSFTLGGYGGAIARDKDTYVDICKHALQASPYHNIQIDESIIGWKEFELEIMRDRNDNNIVVCTIENFDPTGVHTGDSITVAPAQTLTDKEYQYMRNAAIAIMKEIGVDTGGANVQFALHPDTGQIVVIEMNPRVSRSSALVSKATGYPIASIAAKLAVGYTLDTLSNEITGNKIPASFEPTLDYVVTKIPRFDTKKFPNVSPELGVQMKAVGEVMGIGRCFEESFQKALCSLEEDIDGLDNLSPTNEDNLHKRLSIAHPTRIQSIAQAFRNKVDIEDIQAESQIDFWFLRKIKNLVDIETAIEDCSLEDIDAATMHALKSLGFSDQRIGTLARSSTEEVRTKRLGLDCRPSYNRIDSCAAEFEAVTDYMYSTYDGEHTVGAKPFDKSIIIIGSGPNRIGQGIEFDYCCVHAVQEIQNAGYKAIMINSNPETVSTDYCISDRLYFEPLNEERVLDIIEREKPVGVMVQFGGQTALKLVDSFKHHKIPILGSGYETIHTCEDRKEFRKIVSRLSLRQAASTTASSYEECLELAGSLHYPIILRPSYVIGGSSMFIVHSQEELKHSLNAFQSITPPILLEQYLEGSLEIDVDAVSDGNTTFICGIIEHIEAAGIHSGDSAAYFPPVLLKQELVQAIKKQVCAIAKECSILGLVNVQCAIKDDDIYIIEVNARASRSLPFISKVTGKNWVNIATRCILGTPLSEQGINAEQYPPYYAVKESVFPFIKFNGSSAMLGPEMKSTGEVMGIARHHYDAYRKAQEAAGFQMPRPHADEYVLINAFNKDDASLLAITKQLVSYGFTLIAEKSVADRLKPLAIQCTAYENKPDALIIELMNAKRLSFIIHIASAAESQEAVRKAIELNLFYATTLQSTLACIQTFASKQQEYISLQEYYTKSMI